MTDSQETGLVDPLDSPLGYEVTFTCGVVQHFGPGYRPRVGTWMTHWGPRDPHRCQTTHKVVSVAECPGCEFSEPPAAG